MADTSRVVLAANTTSVAAVAASANLRLLGFSVTETVAGTASISLQEGTSTDLTKEIAALSLAASEARTVWFGDYGLPAPLGIWLNRTSGTTRAVVYYRVSDYGKDSGQAPSW